MATQSLGSGHDGPVLTNRPGANISSAIPVSFGLLSPIHRPPDSDLPRPADFTLTRIDARLSILDIDVTHFPTHTTSTSTSLALELAWVRAHSARFRCHELFFLVKLVPPAISGPTPSVLPRIPFIALPSPPLTSILFHVPFFFSTVNPAPVIPSLLRLPCLRYVIPSLSYLLR